MTKLEKKNKAARKRKKSAIGRAAYALLKKMNPGKLKGVRSARIRRLKGGGVTLIPVKAVKR